MEFTTLVVPEPPWARHYRRIGMPTHRRRHAHHVRPRGRRFGPFGPCRSAHQRGRSTPTHARIIDRNIWDRKKQELDQDFRLGPRPAAFHFSVPNVSVILLRRTDAARPSVWSVWSVPLCPPDTHSTAPTGRPQGSPGQGGPTAALGSATDPNPYHAHNVGPAVARRLPRHAEPGTALAKAPSSQRQDRTEDKKREGFQARPNTRPATLGWSSQL